LIPSIALILSSVATISSALYGGLSEIFTNVSRKNTIAYDEIEGRGCKTDRHTLLKNILFSGWLPFDFKRLSDIIRRKR
jgi:hypothetical protein